MINQKIIATNIEQIESVLPFLNKIQSDIDHLIDLIHYLSNLIIILENKIIQMYRIAFSEMDQTIFAKVDESKKSFEASQKIVDEKYAKIDSYLNTIDVFQKELQQLESSLESLSGSMKAQIELNISNIQKKINDYFSLANTLKIEAATLASAVETSKQNYEYSIIELDKIIEVSEDKLKQFESQFSDSIENLNKITIERGKQTQYIQNKEKEFKFIHDKINYFKDFISSLKEGSVNQDTTLLQEKFGKLKALSDKTLENYLHIMKQLEEVNERIDLNSNKLIEIERTIKSKNALIYEFKQVKEVGF